MKYKVKSVTVLANLITDEDMDPTEYLYQDPEYEEEDRARHEAWQRGEWSYVGIQAVAQIEFCLADIPQGSAGFEKISSGGLWGIESDSEESYFAEVYADEVSDLKDRLKALGIGDELITVRPWS